MNQLQFKINVKSLDGIFSMVFTDNFMVKVFVWKSTYLLWGNLLTVFNVVKNKSNLCPTNVRRVVSLYKFS